MAAASSPPAVLIDLEETQKYVLLRVTPADGAGAASLYVRGAAAAEFHADVQAAFQASLLAGRPRAALECLGGGRITFAPPSSYRVHGYSVAFGRADHAAAAALLAAALPAGSAVSHDDEGY
jgi:hypothetical protein